LAPRSARGFFDSCALYGVYIGCRKPPAPGRTERRKSTGRHFRRVSLAHAAASRGYGIQPDFPLHPDLALTEKERLRRTALMAQINLAYKRGDLHAIERLIKEYGEDPEAIVGEDVASRIVKNHSPALPSCDAESNKWSRNSMLSSKLMFINSGKP